MLDRVKHTSRNGSSLIDNLICLPHNAAMKTKDAIKHFGSIKELCKVLDISKQAVSQWGDTVPDGRAFQLHVMTYGELQGPPIKRRQGVS